MEKYSFELKKKIVNEYLSGKGSFGYLSTEVSYWDLVLSAGMNNPPLITKWVNDFRIAGLDALRPKKKG